jgi:hypothetical protein
MQLPFYSSIMCVYFLNYVKRFQPQAIHLTINNNFIVVLKNYPSWLNVRNVAPSRKGADVQWKGQYTKGLRN